MSKLDALDVSILKLLQQNGKRPYSEVAKLLEVSEGTIRSRINRMLNEKVFEFIIHMDPNKIGLQVQAIIGIATKLGYQEQVAMKLNQCREVRFVGVFSGRHDLILQALEVANCGFPFESRPTSIPLANCELPLPVSSKACEIK